MFINDAKAAAVAEIHGEGSDQRKVYISLSNSIGGAFIIPSNMYINEFEHDNRLYFGENWRGAEFGHVTLFPNGKQCYCNKKGCFDAYCNATILSNHTKGNLETFFLN